MDAIFKENVPENVMQSFGNGRLKVATDAVASTPRSARSNKTRPALGVLKEGNKLGGVSQTPKAKEAKQKQRARAPLPSVGSVEQSYGTLGGPSDDQLIDVPDIDVPQLVASCCVEMPGGMIPLDSGLASATDAWVANPEEEPLQLGSEMTDMPDSLIDFPCDDVLGFDEQADLAFDLESIDLGC